MEYVRSCYASEWMLWRGRSDVHTKGRYVFAPEGTRHLSTTHPFGSRNWTAGEWTGQEILGEVRDAKQIWFGGRLPESFPPATRLGGADCLANGARYPQGLPMIGDFVGGFPKRCYGPLQPIPVLTSGPVNINDRAVQAALAGVLQEMYVDVPAAAAILQTLLDRPATMTTHVSTGALIPGIIVATTDAYNIVLVAGVDNELQRALAALYSTVGVVDMGSFGTNAYYWLVANAVFDLMTSAGINPELPTLFVGHSLGGVVAQITAVRMKEANPGTDIRGITYGAPRPGDSRLRTLTANMPWLSIINEGDWIAELPPVFSEWYPLFAEVLADYQVAWRSWANTPNRLVINDVGVVVAPSRSVLTFDELRTVVDYVGEGAPLPAFVNHSIAEYFRRLSL